MKTKLFLMHNALGMGPRRQLKEIIQSIYRNKSDLLKDNKIIISIPGISDFEEYTSEEGIEILRVPVSGFTGLRLFYRLIYDFLIIPYVSYKSKIDVLFCLLNYYPFKLSSTKIIAIRHDYLLNSENTAGLPIRGRILEWFRLLYFKISLLSTNIVIFQNELTKQKFLEKYTTLHNLKLQVIANPVNNIFDTPRNFTDINRINQKILFFPSAYYSHKNHIFLINLAKRHYNFLLENKIFIGLTVDKSNREVVKLLLEIESHSIKSVFINYGTLSLIEMRAAYDTCFAVIYPSLLESFGNALIESLKLGIPIIAINKPYARSACGNSALYFDDTGYDKIIEYIRELIDDQAFYKSVSNACLKQSEIYFTFDVWLNKIFSLSN